MSPDDPPADATFYAYAFRIDGTYRFVLWYGDEEDGLVRQDGRVVTRASLREILDVAAARGLAVESDEPAVYDWDWMERWCAAPSPDTIDPSDHLNAWNMLLDVIPVGAGDGRFREAEGAANELNELLLQLSTGGRFREALERERGEWNSMMLDVALGNSGWEWSRAHAEELANILRLGIADLRRELGAEC